MGGKMEFTRSVPSVVGPSNEFNMKHGNKNDFELEKLNTKDHQHQIHTEV